MKPKSTLRHFLALAGCSVMAVSSASAAGPYYWDGNDSTSGFGTAGGTWTDPTVGTLTSGWSTSNTGITAVDGNSVSTLTTDSINFGTNTTGNGLAVGTITVSGTVNSGNITIGSQSGAIKLDGGTINFADTVSFSAGGSTHEISSTITGANTSFTKLGLNSTLRLSNASNSFGGVITFLGNLEFTSLTDGGSNSSLGSSSSAATNLKLGSSNGQGTLAYIGSSNASTDRLVTLNDVGGSGIANNGSGALTFTNTGALAYGSSAAGQTRILTLGGSYTGGNNTFNPLLANNGTNATSFTKSGAGTWELANSSNSYTGQTNIAGGTLVIGTIADYGTNSAIGQGTAGAGIIIANGNTAGTLIYTGAQQSTNRMVQISTTANAASGIASILNNGTGTLTFTSATFNPTYTNGNNLTRTLALGGTNDGVIQGTIQNSSATVKNGISKVGTGTWTLQGTSSYTSTTAVQEGNLVAGTDSLSATNGAFGNATSDISLGVAGGNSNAGLIIGGAFNVGRNVRLLTSNTSDTGTRVLTIGGNTAHNSEFSGSIFLGTNSQAGRGVSLTAATSGQVTFSGVIQNPTGMDATSYTVTKAGNGTVVLGNSNTYTGGTTITAGTLTITGATQATNSISFTGGSLGLDTGVTVTAASAAVDLTNGAISVTGSTGAASYTLLTAASITGTPVLATSVPGYQLQVIDGATDELRLVQSGGGPGPLDHFAISAIGSPQTVGTPITGITLTAQDASNQTVTGFSGTVTFGGTGGFSGTSATFSSGVLSGVSVTPTISGSNLTFSVTDGVSGKTGSTTIATIQTQYEAWAGGAAFDADANGDGVKNGMAFLLGASGPNAAVTLPTVSHSSGNLILNFTARNNASRGSATLYVQHSSDLGIGDPWASVPVTDAGSPASGVTFSITPGSPNNTVTATISNSEAASGKLFGRLNAVNP